VHARAGGTAAHTLHATIRRPRNPPNGSRLRLVCSAVRLKWTWEMGWR